MSLRTDVTGQGPALVLLHGWAMHAGIFGPLVERLATGADSVTTPQALVLCPTRELTMQVSGAIWRLFCSAFRRRARAALSNRRRPTT